MENGWEEYAEEYNSLAIFDKHNIHTGLGLSGIDPNKIVCHAKNILDVGCGDGTNTYLMYSVEKTNTVGIDIASSAITKAKNNYLCDGCTFLNYDLRGFRKVYDGCPFDLVTFWASLDYIKIDSAFFEELNFLTQSRSRCVVSKFHPMWTALYRNDVEPQCLKSYFENGRIDLITYGSKNKVILERYHYSISYICNIFKDNGWDIKTIDEPKPNIDNSSFNYLNYDSDDVLMERMSVVPMTILLSFERK